MFSVVAGCDTTEQLYYASRAITYAGYGVLGGNGNGSSVNNAGSWGYYWSSTYNNTNNAYILDFNSSGSVNPQDNSNKNNGFAVRCVKDSGERLKAKGYRLKAEGKGEKAKS